MVELSKEIIEKIYEAIEIARNTGKIRRGTNETTKVLERGEAKLIVIANDVAPKEITMHLPILAEEKGVVCVEVPSKADLGVSAGLNISTGSIAILQEGDAKNLIGEIIEIVRTRSK